MRSSLNSNLRFLLIGIILITIIFSFSGLSSTFCYNKIDNDKISYEEFSDQLKNLYADDNYESIVLEDDLSFSDLSKALNFGAVTYASNDESALEYEEIKEICDALGYSVHFDGENYHFDKHFGLKRLVVTGGEVEENYNASNVVTGYKDYTILEYETIEQTEYGYNKLSEQKNLNVSADTVIYSTATNESANTYLSWGAGSNYINIDSYYNYIETNQNKTVVVAVLDSGIDTDHEIFTNRLLRNSNNQIVGARFLNDSSTSFEDDDGHGTHVSGIICDLTPDNVKILPIKVLNSEGRGYSTYMIDALEYVSNLTEYDIVAVNMSISGDNYANAKVEFDNAFNSIKTVHNALSVIAAGNESDNTANYFPACCTDSAVVVSNMTQDKILNTTSNYGSTVDITAPGTSIISARLNGGTVSMSGTSMAAPHVAAVIALLCLDPQYDNSTYSTTIIENRLYDLTEDIGAVGKDTSFGWGMLCLSSALGDINYSASNTTVTYDGSYHNISVTINTAISCEISYRIDGVSNYYTDITSSVFNDAFKNAVNNMTVYFRITPSDNNYSTTYGSAKLTINPINIGISISNQSSVYGENIKSLTWSRISGSYATGESSSSLGLSLTTTATRTGNVGSYPITATWTNKNYNLSFSNGTYTITAKSITITISDVQEVYGVEPNINNCTSSVTGLVNNDTISSLNISYQIDETVSSLTHVGTYSNAISATIRNNNYSATIVPGDYIVIKRPIIIRIEKSSVYGDVPSTSVTSSDYVVTGEYDILTGDNVSIDVTLNSNIINSATPVGNYTNFVSNVTCSNSDYDISVDSTSTYSITKRNIHIIINDREGVYGEVITDDNLAYTIGNGSVVNNDNLNIDLIVNADENDIPGRYYITFSSANTNYNVTSTLGIFTILERPISIITTQTFVYGDDIILDNTNFSLAEDSLSVLYGDEISVTFSTNINSNSDVGTYDDCITLTENDDYYNITLTSSTIIINPRNVTIDMDDKTSTYGNSVVELTYTLYSEGEIVNLSDLINFVEVYPTCAVTSTTGVDMYDITATTSTSKNYNITINNGSYNITPRSVQITINNIEIEYGQPVLDGEISYRLTNGTVIQNDNLNLDYSINLPQINQFGFYDVGEYEITAESNNQNYNVSITSGTCFIQKRKLTISTYQEIEFGSPIVLDNNDFDIQSGSYAGEDRNLNIVFNTSATQNSPIGDYPIIMTFNNSNYDVSLSEGVLKIVGQIIYLTIYNQEFTYGDDIILNDYVRIDGEDVNLSIYSIELLTDATNKSNVGIYNITAISNNENYSLNFAPATLTIQKRDIEIATTQSGVYGYQHTLDNDNYSISEGEIKNNDDLELTLETNATTESSIGKYNVIITGCNNNYNVTISEDSSYTIEKRPIIITTNQTLTYGNDILLNSTYNVLQGEVVSGDDLGLNYYTDAKIYSSVGNYSIDLVSFTNQNYDITFNTGNLNIVAREITISTNQNGTYGDEPILDNSYSLLTGEIVNNDNLELVFTTNATNESIVGSYNISLASCNKNYDITLSNSSYVVNSRPLTISSNQTGEYGNTPTFNVEQYEVLVGNIVNNDDLNLVFTTSANSSSRVGSYDLTLQSYNQNYNITLSSNSSFVITKRQITLTTNQTFEYGDVLNLNNNEYDVTYNNVVNNDDLGLNFSTDAQANSPVGDYEINLNNYSNQNYLITFNTGKLTITPRTIEIEINNASSIYGEEISQLSFKIKEGYTLASGDELTDLGVNLTVNAQLNYSVGDYEISLNDDYNKNYLILCENASYVIIPRQIEIDINNIIATYGDNMQNLTFSLSDGYTLASCDDLDELNIVLSTGAETNRNVGEYDIYLNEYSNENYTITSNVATYLIQPKSILIEINDVSSNYGDQLSALTFSLNENSTLAYNDTSADLNINLTTNATSTSDVLETGYDIVMSGYNNSNYNIDYVPGVYTILPRYILIEIDNKTATYHDEHNLLDVEWRILPGYAIVEGDDLNISLSIDLTQNSGVGNYPINYLCNNGNYDVEAINGRYIIQPKQIEIIIENQSGIYGDTIMLDHNLYEINGDDLASKENLNVTLSVNATQTSNIGDYTISGVCNNINYDANFVNGVYSIEKRKITIDLLDQNVKRFFEYEINQNDYEVVEGSIVNGDNLNIVISSSANWYSNIGSEFELTATFSNENYDVEFIGGVVTIQISTTDIFIIIVAVGLFILLIIRIVLRIRLKILRRKGFTDSFNQLKGK